MPEKWTINRNQIIESLNNAGIGTSVHYKPVHMHSYYKNKYGIKNEDFSNSYYFYNNVITLPLYPTLNNEQTKYIVEFVFKLWEKYQT